MFWALTAFLSSHYHLKAYKNAVIKEKYDIFWYGTNCTIVLPTHTIITTTILS